MNDNWEQVEKRFDEQFKADAYGVLPQTGAEALKSFIHQELSSQKATIREKVEELRNDKERHFCAFNDGESRCECMNKTLDHVLALPELQVEDNK